MGYNVLDRGIVLHSVLLRRLFAEASLQVDDPPVRMAV